MADQPGIGGANTLLGLNNGGAQAFMNQAGLQNSLLMPIQQIQSAPQMTIPINNFDNFYNKLRNDQDILKNMLNNMYFANTANPVNSKTTTSGKGV